MVTLICQLVVQKLLVLAPLLELLAHDHLQVGPALPDPLLEHHVMGRIRAEQVQVEVAHQAGQGLHGLQR